jgi:hypothetical protein
LFLELAEDLLGEVIDAEDGAEVLGSRTLGDRG